MEYTDKQCVPAISVLMSVYKEPLEWLKISTESILNQTFSNFEFIVVIDNPQNKAAIDYITNKAIEDSRIRILKNEKNIGLTKSLNRGLKEAKGKYIARMDADDRSYRDRFEKQFSFMESHPNVIVCGTNVRCVGDVTLLNSHIFIYSSNDQIKAQMLFDSGFAHPTVFIQKHVLDNYKLSYDETYRRAQDYRLWEQLFDYGEYANLPEVLLDYRLSLFQVTHDDINDQHFTIGIRRRMLNKWLLSVGHQKVDFSLDIDRIQLRKELLLLLGNKKNIYFDFFMKTMYFSNKKNKVYFFIRSIINRDFFRMSFYDKIIYSAMAFNRVRTRNL